MPKTASGAIRMDNVRISFVNVFKPKSNDKGEEKYGLTAMFTPDHPDYGLVKDRILAVASKEWGEQVVPVMKAMKIADKICVHDGDGKLKYPEFRGLLYFNAYNLIKPTVYNKSGLSLEVDDGTVYSGCYANIIVDFWAQDNKHGQRVNAEIQGLQFHADGEHLGGGGKTAPAEDFDIADDNPFGNDGDGGAQDGNTDELAGLL